MRSTQGASLVLIEQIPRGLFQTGLTRPLLLEYESVCKRHAALSGRTLAEVDIFVNNVSRFSDYFRVYFTMRPTLADPGNDLVFEAAVASSADWIVTHNRRDFNKIPPLWVFDVITPGEALRRLGFAP